MSNRVLVIGGGLAGLAAAVALARRDFQVTILESRPRLGGRAGSFTDVASGQVIDACQHVSMGCCTNLAHFYRTVGVDHLLAPQAELHFMTTDRRLSRWRADPLPAPFHLARSLLAAHWLNWSEKRALARALAALNREAKANDPPFLDWLARNGQSPELIDRFWSVVLTSALNETPERVGLRYARQVLVQGFLGGRRGWVVEIPRVPLGELYGLGLTGWLAARNVRIRLGEGVRKLNQEHGMIQAAVLRNGTELAADWFIAAVPFDRLLDLLPDPLAQGDFFRRVRQLEPSPITSVHLWYDRPLLSLPHVVIVGGISQWIFNRGEVSPGEHYVQVVVSASRMFRGLAHADVESRILIEMARLFPEGVNARLLRVRTVTEHAATFSAVPGVDRFRPGQATPIANLFLAGDWTRTGWPATMEGAVRSGYLAAEALCRRAGQTARLLQPDLDGKTRYPERDEALRTMDDKG